MNNRQYRNIVYLSDVSGTGFWRHIQQILSLNSFSSSLNINNTFTQFPILDKNYYQGISTISVQRWISTSQKNLFLQFFKPLCEINNAFLMYHIDDDMFNKHIPLFNKGRKAFESPEIQQNIKEMLNASDFVIVTTDKIKQMYHEVYSVPLENLVAIPNLLPRWWFGDKYDLNQKIEQFSKFKSKPRIGIVSSLSHFNVENVRKTKDGRACRLSKTNSDMEKWFTEDNQEIEFNQTERVEDDIDNIIDCIRSTVNDFQWVLFGYCPPKLEDLVKSKKIEFHNGVSILNYPSVFYNLKLQAVVAPIAKIEFNFCKSHIKTMEASALGIPIFATNCLPYNRVMKSFQLFDSSNELKEKLLKLKFMSKGEYLKIIEQQWKWLNSSCYEGDCYLKNYWLEDNLNIWLEIFKIRQNTLNLSYSLIKQNFLKNENEILVKTNDNVQIVR